VSLTYSSYLRVPELLEVQTPQSDPEEHDEMLFIVIHQVYELWFKLTLQEFEAVNRNLSAGELFKAIGTLKRIRMVMKTLVAQLDILETMSPMSFNSFRDRLDAASGFQSVQFRELEFLVGYKRVAMLRHHEGNESGIATLQRRLKEPSVVDHFYDFLETRGVNVPSAVRDKAVEEPTQPDEDVQGAVLALYRTDPAIQILIEIMTDVDEGLQEWRYRHVKMVERTIGDKPGTGGSMGVRFLRDTLFKPIFPDLWAIRSQV
jgi:tryptophan 2,3-dioxygenase